MSLRSTNINVGHLQGIMVGEVYSPREGIALVTLKVKSERNDAGENRRRLHFIQFTAYDEWAEAFLENAADGRIVYVQYRLTTNGKKDENGISRFFNNRTVEKAVFGPVLGEERIRVPYLNKGFLQGEFAGLRRIYGSEENLWSLLVCETAVHDSGRELRRYHRFILNGDEMKFAAGRKKNGESVLVEYRTESRREEKDGQAEHHIDYVLTDLL